MFSLEDNSRSRRGAGVNKTDVVGKEVTKPSSINRDRLYTANGM
jgi:hypothetical protein